MQPESLQIFLMWLAAYGAGNLSLDALLRRKLKIDPVPVAPASPTSSESV